MVDHKRRAVGLGAVAVMAVATLGAGTSAAGASGQGSLADVRRATAAFHDVDAALAAGYVADPECVPGMGYHYINFDLFESTDPTRPAALLYEMNAGGQLRLVAAEWFKVDADQDLSTADDRPEMFGHPFDGPMPGHAPGMPIHYDLHAYVWQGNPDGVLATFNPNVTCPEH